MACDLVLWWCVTWDDVVPTLLRGVFIIGTLGSALLFVLVVTFTLGYALLLLPFLDVVWKICANFCRALRYGSLYCAKGLEGRGFLSTSVSSAAALAATSCGEMVGMSS